MDKRFHCYVFYQLFLGALFSFTSFATIAQSASSQQNLLSGNNEVIPPEKAYILSANIKTPHLLRLKLSIAKGTYLYQEKLRLSIKQGRSVALGEYQLPLAKIKKDALWPDGTTGDALVYYQGIDILVPLIRNDNSATAIILEVRYQGCTDNGVCYPPQIKLVSLNLPPSYPNTSIDVPVTTTITGSTNNTTGSASKFISLATILKGGNYWLMIGIFFLAGLGLALTPCIFPMIPILSGIIIGQGKEITTARAFSISLVYVLAMAVVYTIAGVLVSLLGENLQSAFQNPWVLCVLAGIFVLLALSMFGFYDLQLPSGLQSKLIEISNKQQGGTLIGAAIIGALSALIVGPCVAPALIVSVLVIGQAGDQVLGGTALFALSMGMGAPILAFGTTTGRLLPKAGSWMDIVKSVFGVAMLAVAIIMLARIMPPVAYKVLWGIFLVVTSIFMGAKHEAPMEASSWLTFWRGIGLTLFICGEYLILIAAKAVEM